MTRAAAILGLLVLIGAVSAQTTRVPVKVEGAVDVPNWKPALDALTKRVADLEKKVAALSQPTRVTLQLLETTGKPTAGITIKQYIGTKEVAQFTPDRNGECVVEFK